MKTVSQNKQALLLYSGGLDTSFCIPYLQEQGYQITTVTINTGGFTEKQLKEITIKAKKLGSKKHFEIDAKKDLYQKFASYIIKANYLKGGVYPACVGPERIVIAQKAAEIAKKEKITTIVHGSTGAGNDQVRFDLGLKALIPNCQIITPIRENNLTRTQEADFLKSKGFPVEEVSKDYSINIGLLGTTIGGKETLNTFQPLPENIFPTVKTIDASSKNPTKIKINFEKGLPTKLNGKKTDPIELINQLNKISAENGFGKDYHIGTTIIGLKGKVGFEAPAMKLLIKAHTELEKVVLTSKQIFWKNTLGTLYGDMIHEGLYFDPLVKNLEAFLDSANEFITGAVEIEIHKGNLNINSIISDYSLFKGKIGTYGEVSKAYTGADAKGFCQIYGLEGINAFLTQQQ